MKDILKAFRGDLDEFEITRPMKFLLCSFGIMLIVVPISLYVMLLDVSVLVFATFSCILVVDLVLMVLTDVLIVLIWWPWCFPKGQKRDKSNPGCASQCLPMQITTDSVCSTPNDMFQNISVGELTRRLDGLQHEEDEQGPKERNESLPRNKPVCAVQVHKISSGQSNNPNLDQNRDVPQHVPVQRFGNVTGHQQQVSFNPQRRDVIKGVENLTYGYAVDASTRAYEPNQKSANEYQSWTFTSHFSVPGPSQKGYHKKQQHLTTDPRQRMGKENTEAAQSRACGPTYANLDQRETSHGHVSIPVPLQEDGFAGYRKEQRNPNPSSPQQCMTEMKQNSTSRYASGVDQSNACERTNVSQDQNGASSRHVSVPPPQEDGSRREGHHTRFWTEPQPCTRDSTKRDEEVNLSSESLNEVIKNRYKKPNKFIEVKPEGQGFTKLIRRCNRPDYMESAFRRRMSALSCVPPSRIDDALGLVPISYGQSKQSSTAAWVNKNELPSNCDSEGPPSLKRSRSAPSRRNRFISSTTRPSDTSNRLPIPAIVGDNRHRVLHRLLATILTTGDDDIFTNPEKSDKKDVPKMEVEALPSGDYVMHISMRLTSNELQNFKSKRVTIIKDSSEFKKYFATLC